MAVVRPLLVYCVASELHVQPAGSPDGCQCQTAVFARAEDIQLQADIN